MRKITSFFITSLITFLICFFIFLTAMLYFVIPKPTNEKTAQKAQSSVPYYNNSGATIQNAIILLKIENCPIKFFITLSPKASTLSVNYEEPINTDKKYTHCITFERNGFENTVNFLGGVEIETPYGLPCPAKNKKIIAKDEKLLAFGASLGELLTTEPAPSNERKSYYCYVVKELCLKFFSNCTTESYKFLKKNCETDISYTEFYDNYKSLENIKRWDA